jgi:hypothetical protein
MESAVNATLLPLNLKKRAPVSIYGLVGATAYLYDNGKDFLPQRGSNFEPLSL